MEKIVESGPDMDESDGFPCEDKAVLQVPKLPLGRDRKKGTPSMMRSISLACNNLGQDEESKVEEPRGISPTNANAEMRRFSQLKMLQYTKNLNSSMGKLFALFMTSTHEVCYVCKPHGLFSHVSYLHSLHHLMSCEKK